MGLFYDFEPVHNLPLQPHKLGKAFKGTLELSYIWFVQADQVARPWMKSHIVRAQSR